MSPHESDVAAFLRGLDIGMVQNRLTNAVKKEWGNRGVASDEPYITNGAHRAVLAVLAELERIAEGN